MSFFSVLLIALWIGTSFVNFDGIDPDVRIVSTWGERIRSMVPRELPSFTQGIESVEDFNEGGAVSENENKNIATSFFVISNEIERTLPSKSQN